MAQNIGQKLHYEGVLEKAGKRFFEGFRKRWFILDGKHLSYYKAPETIPQNLLGIIDLTKVKAVVPFKMINNNAFQIITSMRTYTFTAATPQLMTEWISVLRQAMQIDSFTNKRAKHSSVRKSVEDSDAGYEVVSRSSSITASDPTLAGEDDLYDQVTDKESSSIGSYDSVGSIKRTSSNNNQQLDDYDNVRPSPTKSPPQINLGTYGVVGECGPQSPRVPDVYATVQKNSNRASTEEITIETEDATYDEVGSVQKNRASTEEITIETEDATYDVVGSVETKQTKQPNMEEMPIICESDDDEDEDEQEDDSSAFVEENLDDIKDPCPPPKGESYAVDQIKRLLKDFTGDESFKLNQEDNREVTENTVVPESCEKAFAKLRDFLGHLDSN